MVSSMMRRMRGLLRPRVSRLDTDPNPAPVRMADPTATGGNAPKVHYLIGEAGYPNYGDELIAREWVKYLAMIDPDTPVVLDCMCSGPAAAIVYGGHPRVMAVDTIAQLAHVSRETLLADSAAGAVDAEAIAGQVIAALDDEGQAPRYAAGLHLLTRRMKDCHIIGGGYMHSEWNAGLARLGAAQWAAMHGIPSAVSGVGLEPLNAADARFAGDVACAVDAFSLRDRHSRERIDPTHEYTTLAPDDCFVNGLEDVYRADTGSLPDTMLCIQADLVDDRSALLDHVLAVLDAWGVQSGERIGIVECIPRDSIDTVEILGKHGFEPILFPLQHLLDLGFPARPGQRWLSTRYHPHLLAAARGCSGSYIVVKPGYYDVKHEAVLRMGSRWSRTTVGERDIPEPGPGFADPSVRVQYREQIRRQVAPLYGIPLA